MTTVLVWAIAAAMIAGILFRPFRSVEAVWAVSGAALLVVCGLLPLDDAFRAAAKGTDVYLFLAGMMLLSELARREGVFDWMAEHAALAADGSPARLFGIVYGVGILVTAFLSNDATAVVLTPAVYAAVRKSRAEPLPYLLACAFVANAASFVLPISNPANLVVYGARMPALVPWLRLFFAPSVLSIGATFAALWWISNRQFEGSLLVAVTVPALTAEGRRAMWGLAIGAAAMTAASALGLSLGAPTCLAALAALVITNARPGAVASVFRGVTWSVLPLVAGLFVMVEALGRAGALDAMVLVLHKLAEFPPVGGLLAGAFGIAALANVMNNLPSGLLAGSALAAAQVPDRLRHAILLGTDLGPNLSVYGSLATVLWLVALRREGAHINGWTFFKAGALVMPPALLLATLAMALTAR